MSVVKPVNTLLESARVRDAIHRLVTHGGALPVVARDGRLLASSSKSDLKMICAKKDPNFDQNIMEFIRQSRSDSSSVRTHHLLNW